MDDMDVGDYANQLGGDDYGIHQIPQLQHLYSLSTKSRFTVIELLSETSPLRNVLDRACEEANKALDSLINADLFTDAGVVEARKLQATIQRHMDLIRWVEAITLEGDEAAASLRNEPIDDFVVDGEDEEITDG